MHDTLRAAVVRAYPDAAEVLDIQPYRPGYRPYPARITVRTTAGRSVACVLKASAQAETLAYEAQVLRAVAELDLPVPRVLGGPAAATVDGQPLAVLLISELPGQPLPWIGLTDLAAAHRTCLLLQTAVDALHALTPRISAHPVARSMPRITLESELQAIMARGGPWCDVPFFAKALALVQAVLPRYGGPLVFSNGDYNPLNFLSEEGVLTGWVDFEHACFEDPHIGFAKFLLWADDEIGWGVGAKAGLVERYLFEHQVPPDAFLVRLVLRGLRHMQDASPATPPHYMAGVIADAARRLGR